MKNQLIVAFVSVLLASPAWATSSVSTCEWSINDNKSGDLVAEGRGYVRLGHQDIIPLVDGLLELTVFISEERVTNGSFGYVLDGSVSSEEVDSFFNPKGISGFGASFGNEQLFGALHCMRPETIPFYFVVGQNQVLVLEESTRIKEAYDFVTNTEACVAGSLETAVDQLKNQYVDFDPFQTLEVTSEGLEWLEIYRARMSGDGAVDSEGSSGVPIAKINGPKVLPKCD